MGIGPSRRELHTTNLEEESYVDPDDGNSWSCSACTLPIFTTPFKSHHTNMPVDGGGGHQLFLHDQCASNVPKELIGHAHHPQQPLILRENQNPTINSSSCDKCERKCGSKYYQCPVGQCDFRLDLLCALPIKILHRSHEHRLMVIKSSALFFCGACGTLHLGSSAHLSYLCDICDFWIHPDCASLPNAIILLHPAAHHQHSLFLTYNFPRPSGSTTPSRQDYTCAICRAAIRSLGVYFCTKSHYYAHIKCATSSPQRFKPVLIREAKLAGLLHFPMTDEYTSVMQTIMGDAASSSDGAGTRDEHRQSEDKLFEERLHPHPLSFHGEDDDFDGADHPRQSPRVCNACVQFISPPFYNCSQCRDFFLHCCCANLPREINHTIYPKHTLFLFRRAPKSNTLSGLFSCKGCGSKCNGFSYSCYPCGFHHGCRVRLVASLNNP